MIILDIEQATKVVIYTVCLIARLVSHSVLPWKEVEESAPNVKKRPTQGSFQSDTAVVSAPTAYLLTHSHHQTNGLDEELFAQN